MWGKDYENWCFRSQGDNSLYMYMYIHCTYIFFAAVKLLGFFMNVVCDVLQNNFLIHKKKIRFHFDPAKT